MAMKGDSDILTCVFGADSIGTTPEERARSSMRRFVRSQDGLALDNERATGLRLSAWQALKAYGLETLIEVLEYRSAVLPARPEEPAATLKRQREELGLTREAVARAAGLDVQDVLRAEDPAIRNDIHVLAKLAQALALDEMQISYTSGAGADTELATRLRQMGGRGPQFTPRLVTGLTEAAWVVRAQAQLQTWIDPGNDYWHRYPQFEPNDNYGSLNVPSWEHGYYLAEETRRILGLEGRPIESLRSLIEDVLRIPLVQMELPRQIGGATVAVGSRRGLVANTVGHNQNVWVRRATLAHELGHLLWDPDQRLQKVVVDDYEGLFSEQPAGREPSNVEARANAFAIAFLAPRSEVRRLFLSTNGRDADRVRAVMEVFGISFTAARYHLANTLGIALQLVGEVSNEPTPEWQGRESYTLDLFRPPSVPLSRRGRLVREVISAEDANLVSEDAAASYLGCTLAEYVANKGALRSYYP